MDGGIMTDREIMQQAYDAMNDLEGYRPDIDRAMAALRQALAQPEQESVAWRCTAPPCKCFDASYAKHCAYGYTALPKPEQEPVAYADALDLAKDCNWDTFICKHSSENHEGTRFKIPLYTTPPRKPWVGLTDEERNEMIGRIQHDQYTRQRDLINSTQIITEMYLKELNGG